jgi:spermidine synthase
MLAVVTQVGAGDATLRFNDLVADPIEEGPAYLLYTREFYGLARERLAAGGIICVQSGSAALTELLNFTAVRQTLGSVFAAVYPYSVDVPSFGGPWGFCLASDGLDLAPLTPAEVDKRRIGEKVQHSPEQSLH